MCERDTEKPCCVERACRLAQFRSIGATLNTYISQRAVLWEGCGRVSIPEGARTPLGPFPFAKPCHHWNPFPMTDRKVWCPWRWRRDGGRGEGNEVVPVVVSLLGRGPWMRRERIHWARRGGASEIGNPHRLAHRCRSQVVRKEKLRFECKKWVFKDHLFFFLFFFFNNSSVINYFLDQPYWFCPTSLRETITPTRDIFVNGDTIRYLCDIVMQWYAIQTALLPICYI